jgi:hypothetical protein
MCGRISHSISIYVRKDFKDFDVVINMWFYFKEIVKVSNGRKYTGTDRSIHQLAIDLCEQQRTMDFRIFLILKTQNHRPTASIAKSIPSKREVTSCTICSSPSYRLLNHIFVVILDDISVELGRVYPYICRHLRWIKRW